MFTHDEVKVKLEKILEKPFSQFSVQEKALLVDIVDDASFGRYPLLLSSSKSEIEEFMKWVMQNTGEHYSNLSDGMRRALEDVYFNKV